MIGHRGAPAYAPENTVESFALALELGADHLEFDIRTTRDGHLVVSHDDDLMHGSDPDVEPISASTLAALERVDLGSSFNRAHPRRARDGFLGAKIPTLAGVLDRFMGRAGMLVEIKELGPARSARDRFLSALRERGFGKRRGRRDRVLSFEPQLLMELRERDAGIPLVQSFARSTRVTEGALTDCATYARGICVWREKVDEKLIERARGLDLEVYVYTVNRRARMERLLELGVDGIITDVPERLAEIVTNRVGTR